MWMNTNPNSTTPLAAIATLSRIVLGPDLGWGTGRVVAGLGGVAVLTTVREASTMGREPTEDPVHTAMSEGRRRYASRGRTSAIAAARRVTPERIWSGEATQNARRRSRPSPPSRWNDPPGTTATPRLAAWTATRSPVVPSGSRTHR